MRFSCLCRVRRADVAAAVVPAMFAQYDDAATAAGDPDDAAAAVPAMFEQYDAFAAGDSDAAGTPVMFEESDAAAISLSEDDRLEL